MCSTRPEKFSRRLSPRSPMSFAGRASSLRSFLARAATQNVSRLTARPSCLATCSPRGSTYVLRFPGPPAASSMSARQHAMIEPDLASLLEPLERFEGLRRKASRLGDRLADLSYANPYA